MVLRTKVLSMKDSDLKAILPKNVRISSFSRRIAPIPSTGAFGVIMLETSSLTDAVRPSGLVSFAIEGARSLIDGGPIAD